MKTANSMQNASKKCSRNAKIYKACEKFQKKSMIKNMEKANI